MNNKRKPEVLNVDTANEVEICLKENKRNNASDGN